MALLIGCNSASRESHDVQTWVDRLTHSHGDHTESREAHASLMGLGVAAFPVLVRNVGDSRPACGFLQREAISATTVGDACHDIISMQVERYTPCRTDPRFLRPDNIDSWWQKSHDKSLCELQIEALEWAIHEIRENDRYEHLREQRLSDLRRDLARLRPSLRNDKRPDHQDG